MTRVREYGPGHHPPAMLNRHGRARVEAETAWARFAPRHELPSRCSDPFRLVRGLRTGRRRHPWGRGTPLIPERAVGLKDHPPPLIR